MIKSMTGFGRGESSAGPFHALVEVRSVNHRFADLKLRLPSHLADLEQSLHGRLKKKVRRGRLDVTVNVSKDEVDSVPVEINRGLVEAYIEAARRLKDRYNLAGEVTIDAVMALPDVMRPGIAAKARSRAEQAAILEAFDRALAAHDAMRVREGAILLRDIRRRVASIDRLRRRIQKRAPRMLPGYARRLKARIRELNGSGGRGRSLRLEDARLAQEVAIAAERSDITEELVRLGGYLEQAIDLLRRASGPIGKKLDFIMQEMNREANTINSKAIDLKICQDALEVKGEVEKIREQVQNIE